MSLMGQVGDDRAIFSSAWQSGQVPRPPSIQLIWLYMIHDTIGPASRSEGTKMKWTRGNITHTQPPPQSPAHHLSARRVRSFWLQVTRVTSPWVTCALLLFEILTAIDSRVIISV